MGEVYLPSISSVDLSMVLEAAALVFALLFLLFFFFYHRFSVDYNDRRRK